jgi:hypothetical protein
MNGGSLERMVQGAEFIPQVRKCDLHEGDLVYVKTYNSVYAITSVREGFFKISGGWFAKKGFRSALTKINGCTWGGSVIKTDIVAGCGLSLEFGNRVCTSAIQKIFLLRRECLN